MEFSANHPISNIKLGRFLCEAKFVCSGNKEKIGRNEKQILLEKKKFNHIFVECTMKDRKYTLSVQFSSNKKRNQYFISTKKRWLWAFLKWLFQTEAAGVRLEWQKIENVMNYFYTFQKFSFTCSCSLLFSLPLLLLLVCLLLLTFKSNIK